MPTLLHGVYGLGSKDFNKYNAAAVIENMWACFQGKTRKYFLRDYFVGIEGPYALEPKPLPDFKNRELGMTFIGIGAEGVKTALETAALIYAEGNDNGKRYIQSGARYGAARKGAPVFMNLRISSGPIRNSSELTEHDVLAFFNDKFLSGEILRDYLGGLNENGLLVINSSRTKDEIMGSFPREMRELISKRKIKIIVLDATRAALKHLKRNLPGAMMLGLINGETKILSADDFGNRFQSILEQKLGPKKGREIVESNIALLNEGSKLAASTPEQMPGAFAGVSDRPDPVAAIKPEDFGKGFGTAGLRTKLSPKDEMGTIKPVNLIKNYQKQFEEDMVKPILEGKNVSWDRFLPVVPAATCRFRDMSYIGTQIPVWDAKKCIACGMCAALCPDSAIYS
ncbi:MAG: 2-oxoacid:acceptor oxidoreductase family protein, partial [Deltaproteobacteria bacterium]|nr:2-oxoacid:acceptor oxidoreductase family protein [Deltaproteobacteria bacterium]